MGPDVKGHVYVREGEDWKLGDNAVQVPEGWYAVPPSFVK